MYKLDVELTLGNVTFGTTTVFKALGAFLGAAFLSPLGWYWYLKCLLWSSWSWSTSHGMELFATETSASEVAEVGFRPK